jgi:hypothetical protein
MRRLGLTALLLPLLAGSARASGLYEATVIVTGMDARSRPAGLGTALAQAVAKVSGNPALLDDPHVAALAPLAPSLVESMAYLDRMSDLPHRDEQGTRDRPYDLQVRFDPAMLDSLLAGLGEIPWRVRPALAVAIRIEPRNGPTLLLHADTDPDERHRAALLAAADQAGLQVVLPLEAPLLEVTGAVPLLRQPDLVLRGSLSWQEGTGWAAQFTLPWHGRQHAWGVDGVGFDAAYREAMRGAARVLSGHDRE